MKKRCLIVILICVVLFPMLKTASAVYKEEIFDGWVYDEGNFSAGGETFYATINARLNLVSIRHGEDKTVVTMAECKDAFGFNFCFSDKEIWYHDSLDRDYYKARIKVYEYLGKLVINRTFSSYNLLINEKPRVDVKIENIGALLVTNVEFVDPYTEEFIILDNENCVISGSSVRWRGNIDVGSKIKCSYRIKPIKKVTYTSQASAKYFNGKKSATSYSPSVKLNVPDHRLGINTSLSKKAIDIDDDTRLYINLSNLHSTYELTILNFRVDIPLGLEVISKGALFNKMEDYVSIVGVPLLAGTSKDTYIVFRGKRSGMKMITANIRYEINSVTNELQVNLTEINITKKDLELYIHLPTVMMAEESYKMNITVKNPSSDYAYKSIRTYLKTDLPGLEEKDFGIISWLDRGKQQEIEYAEVSIPLTKGRKKHYISLEAYYLTMNGEYLKQKVTKYVEVVGEGVPINITEPIETNVTITNASEDGKKGITIEIPKVLPEKIKIPASGNLIIAFIVLFIIADVFLVISIIKKIKKE